MTQNVLLEAFGSITNENIRNEGVSLEDVAVEGLRRVDELLDLDEVGTIFTGMNEDFTNVLEDLAEESDEFDIEVQPFYPNIGDIMDEDDVDYNTAWQSGFNWRNGVLLDRNPDEDQDSVQAVVRLCDASGSGEELVRQAYQKGALSVSINLDHLVDRDKAYGGGDSEADAEADGKSSDAPA